MNIFELASRLENIATGTKLFVIRYVASKPEGATIEDIRTVGMNGAHPRETENLVGELIESRVFLDLEPDNSLGKIKLNRNRWAEMVAELSSLGQGVVK